MDDPACVRRMLDEIRSCNFSASLRNVIHVGSTLVPTRLGFDKSFILSDNKKKKFMGSNDSFILTDNNKVKFTDSNFSVITTEVCRKFRLFYIG
jgi:hypothetical protein